MAGPKPRQAETERLREALVAFVLEVRAAYLATGASPLKHWDQLQSRMLSAAKRSGSIEEWATLLTRGLNLPALSNSGSSSLLTLVEVVSGLVEAEVMTSSKVLGMIEREMGLLMAMARAEAERRRDARDEAAAVEKGLGNLRERFAQKSATEILAEARGE